MIIKEILNAKNSEYFLEFLSNNLSSECISSTPSFTLEYKNGNHEIIKLNEFINNCKF